MAKQRKLAQTLFATALCFTLVRQFEKYEQFPYQDAAGHWTVGYGHKILPGEDFSSGVSKPQAEALLRVDIEKHQKAVQKYVKVPITQDQFDALCSFTFNLGTNTLKDSGMLKELNKGNHDEALRRLQMYVNARDPDTGQKEKLRGLVRRRTAEKDMWEGNYSPHNVY